MLDVLLAEALPQKSAVVHRAPSPAMFTCEALQRGSAPEKFFGFTVLHKWSQVIDHFAFSVDEISFRTRSISYGLPGPNNESRGHGRRLFRLPYRSGRISGGDNNLSPTYVDSTTLI
jgi:hypothetical protein